MIKTQKGFDLLEKLVATNLPLARIIALKIPTDKLDCGTLIEFQQSSDSNVRNLARELLLKNFPDGLPDKSKEEDAGSEERRILAYFQ